MSSRIRELAAALTTGGKNSSKIALTAILSSLLSVGVAFYLATHLKPYLTVSISYGQVITGQSEPNKLITVLLDLTDYDAPRIASAYKVTFRSAHDFTERPERNFTRIAKFILYNGGWATANHVIIGIGIPPGSGVFKIVASPNVTILSDTLVQASASYPPYRKIEIDRLGISEQALLTVLMTCGCGDPPPLTSRGSQLYIATDPPAGYAPVLFLSSAEGTGEILGGMDMKNAFAVEKSLFPSSTSGYWAPSIDVAKNAPPPKLEPSSHVELEMSMEGRDGKRRKLSLTFP